MSSILVIDDERGIRETLKDILEDDGHRAILAEDALIGLDLLARESVELVILDVWLPRMGGIDALKAIRERHPGVEVIVVSGHASIDMAVNAVKLGAFDFIEKPLSIDRVGTAVRNAEALIRLRMENARLKRAAAGPDDILGSSPAIKAVKDLIEQSARSDARVLISGENGTGKELAARRIHELSERASGPFVAVNCAAIPDTLLESELFGHEKGSFTDAVSRRKGKFELAHRGTLFLDEIADMSPSAQAKVLRAVQELKFERLGGEETIESDVRVIAASNKDLREEIAAGRFREDLYFRLSVIPIRMPPLRERDGDVAALAEAFLREHSGGRARRFSPEAIALLEGHDWPGNIRELKNCVERIAVMSDEDPIGPELVERLMGPSGPAAAAAGEPCELGSLLELRLADAKEEFERRYILHKLKEAGYNVTKAAEAIGVYPSNLHAKIKKLGIEAGS